MITIIIPFYQKKSGLLSRAVTSIINQDFHGDFKILVVDDSSPINAQNELASIDASIKNSITIIKQPNGGPASARNRALDQVEDNTSVLAFLDSDDEWEPDHLKRMQYSFDQGADFYFADHQREGIAETRFKEVGFDLSEHELFDKDKELYWFKGNLFDKILKGSPVGTSSVAYNYRAMPDLRFKTDLWAGEDTLFWMAVSRRAKRVAFSPACAVQYGTGVNIFAGSQWGTVAGMFRALNTTQFHLHVASTLVLDAEQSEWNDQFVKVIDLDFMQSALVCAIKNKPGWAGITGKYLKARPQSILRIPAAASGMIKAKLARGSLAAEPR